MRLIERNQLGLTRGTNQLLASERGIADEGLESRFDPGPEIDDICGEILGRARLIEMSQDGARAIE
jgi:hypothetical protein